MTPLISGVGEAIASKPILTCPVFLREHQLWWYLYREHQQLGEIKYSYRIYEISKENNDILGLLENSDSNIPESEYEKNFLFKKKIVVDFGR